MAHQAQLFVGEDRSFPEHNLIPLAAKINAYYDLFFKSILNDYFFALSCYKLSSHLSLSLSKYAGMLFQNLAPV